mgnify:CR=1 FL=1
MNIGERLRDYRLKRGITQKDLSDKTGLSYTFINEIEHDKKIPSIETLLRMSSYYGATVSELLGETTPEMSPELKSLFDNIKSLPPDTINLLNAFITALSQGQNPQYGKQDIDGETVQYLYDAKTHPKGMTEEEVRKGLEIQKKLDAIRKNKEDKK